MNVKNNYNECITNVACSIRKYFNLTASHNTLKEVDDILKEKNPENVIVLLFDGMGANILDRTLSKNSYFRQHKVRNLTTVFPATTVAATTSILTGLNPVESGMLGWNMYFKDIDKTITVYEECPKDDKTRTPLKEAKVFKEKYMKDKSIIEEINEQGKYKAYKLFPFGKNAYTDLDDMMNKINALCKKSGKKYIYAYDDEPDMLMHDLGPDSREVKDLIRYRNLKVEELSKNLQNAVIIVLADHGHILVNNEDLNNYPDITACLERTTSLEPRAVNFFIKSDKKEEFASVFNMHFKDTFDLYPKDEIIQSSLFGSGHQNPIFISALGDYIAIAKANTALIYGENSFKSHHAGYTDDEIYIPLIIDTCN